MTKIYHIFKIFQRWIVYVPLSLLTAFNIYRQEINPNLPPFVSIIPNWHWGIWLSMFLITIIVDLSWQLYKKPDNDFSKLSSMVGSQTSGRDSVVSGRDTIINPLIESPPPNIIVGISDGNTRPSPKITMNMKPLPPRPDLEQIINEEKNKLIHKKSLTNNQTSKLRLSDDKYQKEAEEYLFRFRKHLNDSYSMSIVNDRYKTINLTIEADGDQHLSEVFVEIKLPNSFHFLPDNLEKQIRINKFLGVDYKLTPPPQPDIYIRESYFDMMLSQPIYAREEFSEPEDYNRFKILERDGNTVLEYHIKDLIQNRQYIDLKPFSVLLDDIENSTKWNIPIKIFEKQLKRPVELYVEIEAIVREQ